MADIAVRAGAAGAEFAERGAHPGRFGQLVFAKICQKEGGTDLALGFVDALEAAYRRFGTSPHAGSPRYAHELDLPGLRFWPLRRCPYLIFYIEQNDPLDVWRVLHGQRDAPSWLQESV